MEPCVLNHSSNSAVQLTVGGISKPCTDTHIFVGDEGTKFVFSIKECDDTLQDITDVTLAVITFKKPNYTKIVETGVIDTVASTVSFITTAGFLDIAGDWKVQITIATPTGKWSSSVKTINIKTKL